MSKKVLLVDDDQFLVRHMAAYLREEELDVRTAFNGREGLEIFRSERPQLVILDYRMPEMDGIEFLRILQAEGIDSASVIMLAGNDDEDLINTGYDLGIHAFLTKPVNMLVLKGMLFRAFDLLETTHDLRKQIVAKERAFNLLQVTFDSIAEGVITLDPQFRIRMISSKAAEILKLTKKESLGKPAGEVLGSRFTAPGSPLMRCVKANSRLTNIKTVLESPTGFKLNMAITINSIDTEKGKLGWIVLFRDLRKEDRAQSETSEKTRFGNLVSADPKMKEVFQLVNKVAPSNVNVLVEGESGTGKELIAQEIHKRSARAYKPFHAVNCAAIPPHLMESEFFGHERGSFTGADQMKRGRFEAVDGGTLFLDEIGEMPLEMQGKLLRVLQEKKFERVGGTKLIEVDFRVVAATNRDLRKMVSESKFREDLFYRLRVVPLNLPPLRERVLDIPLLVKYMVEKFKKQHNTHVRYMSPDALQLLMEHNWPGNIRELVNVIEYCFVVCTGPVLQIEHLPKELQTQVSEPATAEARSKNEKEFILQVLESVNYKKGKAAAKMGVNPSTLYRKMKKYGIS